MTGSTLEEALREALAGSRGEQYDALGVVPLRWLALLPEWTDDLAERCEFPVPPKDLRHWLGRAAAGGICEVRAVQSLDGAGTVAFRMPAHRRSEFLAAPQSGTPRELVGLAQQIAASLPGPLDATVTISCWRRLVEAGPLESGAVLVMEALASIDAERIDLAQDWIAAGESLAPVLGGELASAVARGRRRVSLEYRRRVDRRLLARFVPRPTYLDAVVTLLDAKEDTWALHLLGMGGVGKTMLIRYLATSFAAEHKRKLTVGRIDFDHVDPRFPFERPAQLLVELADALAPLVVTGAQERALDAFVEQVRRADEAALSAPAEPLARIASPALQAALDAFAGFVATFSEPVLLILDTCEELAKLHPTGRSVPSVDAMWALLEGVHERIPGLRVLLAGRRLLATEGAGWARDEQASGHPFLTGLAPRPFLLLREMRGFDDTEATEFLEKVMAGRRDLHAAVLARASETGRVPGTPGGSQGVSREMWNPFDLSLYAQWAADHDDLSAEDIAEGAFDAYVDARIVARLGADALEAALPAVALLGRFDLAMLEPAVPDAADGRRLIEVLAEQEWIDVTDADEPGRMVLEVEPHLLPRLRGYFEHPARRGALRRARAALVPALRALLLEGPLDALAVDRADAALRLSPPVDGADLWDALERRIVDTGSWWWADRAAERLLADDDLTGVPRHPHLRAHVRATHLAALRHLQPSAPPERGAWDAVREWAGAHPVEPIAGWLRARAEINGARDKVSVGRREGRAPALAIEVARISATADDPWHAEQLLAATLALVETLLDAGPTRADIVTVREFATATSGSHASRELRAALAIAAARSAPAAAADERFAAAMRLAAELEAPAPQRWLDWVAPHSIADRAALERVIETAVRGHGPLSTVLRDRMLAAAAPGGVDALRLASALLLDTLGHGRPPDLEPYERIYRTARAETRPPPALAHDRVPPLFVALARAWSALGHPSAALSLLEEHEQRAASSRSVDRTAADEARAARLERLRLIARWRLADEHASEITGAVFGPESSAAERLAGSTCAGLGFGPRFLPAKSDKLGAHAAWRAFAQDEETAERLQHDVLELYEAHRLDAAPEMALALDLEEARQMGLAGRPDRLAASKVDEACRQVRRLDARTRPFEPQWPRLLLRARALDVPSGLLRALERLPQRWLAQLELEEGELLALRHPAAAQRLLISAAERAGDPLIATAALTAATLAAFRGGAQSSGEELADAVRERYELARAEVAVTLPAIDELLAAPPQRGDGWDPWLARVRASQEWAQGHFEPASAPELRPPDTPPDTPPEALAAQPVGSTAPMRALRFASVVSVLIGAAVAAYTGWQAVKDGGVWLGVAGAGIAIIGLLAVLVDSSWFRRRFVSVSALVTPSVTGLALVVVRRRILGLPLRTETVEVATDPSVWFIARLSPRLLKGFRGLSIHVEPGLDPLPWERLLLMHGEHRQIASADVWREPWLQSVEAFAEIPGVVVLGPERWLVLADDRWGTSGERVRLATDPDELEDSRFGVVHLIGTAASTRGGWRLRVDDGELEAPSSVRRAAVREERLVPAQAVAHLQPSLVVVQGLPGTPDASAAHGLRGFAAECVAGGPRAALVIPPLPVELADTVVGIVVRHVAQHRGRREHLWVRGMARDVRHELYRRATADLALDTCLYLESGAR